MRPSFRGISPLVAVDRQHINALCAAGIAQLARAGFTDALLSANDAWGASLCRFAEGPLKRLVDKACIKVFRGGDRRANDHGAWGGR